MANIAAGHLVIKDFARALGMEGRHIRRLVLDVSVSSAVKVYVEEYVSVEDVQNVASLVRQHSVHEIEVPATKTPESSLGILMALAVLERDRATALALADAIINDPEKVF